MTWAGSPFAQLIEFNAGLPTGVVSYRLMGHDGVTALHSGTVVSEYGAVSALLVIDAEHNECALPLFENRTLIWYYATASGIVTDRVTYRVERPLPLAVSVAGVRNKLGLSEHEISDEAVDLVMAYAEFQNMVGDAALTTAIAAGDRTSLLCNAAVEAVAALALLPTLQLRAAQQETSGTNQYARFGTIDWSYVEVDLLGIIAKARFALDATYDAYGDGTTAFQVAPRDVDAVTNETN